MWNYLQIGWMLRGFHPAAELWLAEEIYHNGVEPLLKYGIGIVTSSYLVIMIHHFLFLFRRLENFLYALNSLFGEKSVHRDYIKTQWFDVSNKNGVTIDHHGFFKVDSFKKSISESLIKAGISNEIGMWVNIPKTISIKF